MTGSKSAKFASLLSFQPSQPLPRFFHLKCPRLSVLPKGEGFFGIPCGITGQGLLEPVLETKIFPEIKKPFFGNEEPAV